MLVSFSPSFGCDFFFLEVAGSGQERPPNMFAFYSTIETADIHHKSS
jgi:hypothetical protein